MISYWLMIVTILSAWDSQPVEVRPIGNFPSEASCLKAAEALQRGRMRITCMKMGE